MIKTYVTGHNGMVGSAIIRELKKNKNNREIITESKESLDLTDQFKVNSYIKKLKPDEIIIAAAKVGGIHANSTYPAEFIYDNLTIASNLIHAAYTNNVKKLLYLGSSCIYPRESSQPIIEESLLTGPLESTNECMLFQKLLV